MRKENKIKYNVVAEVKKSSGKGTHFNVEKLQIYIPKLECQDLTDK